MQPKWRRLRWLIRRVPRGEGIARIPYIPGVSIREPANADWPAIESGFEDAFRTTRSSAEWDWKYGPRRDRVHAEVAFDPAGDLVAYYGGLIVKVQVDAHIERAVQPVDVYRLRRPGTEGEMVFSSLTDHFFAQLNRGRHCSFAYGFPGQKHFDIGLKRLGYCAPVEVGLWTRAVEPSDLAPVSQVVSSRHITQPSASQLWRSAKNRYPVAVVRDYSYLVRRFISNGDVSYEYRTFFSGSTPTAWVVFRCCENAVQLVDLLWNGENPAVIRAVDIELGGFARQCGVDSITMWLNNDDVAKDEFVKLGWAAAQSPDLVLTARVFVPWLNPVDLVRRMYVTSADADLV